MDIASTGACTSGATASCITIDGGTSTLAYSGTPQPSSSTVYNAYHTATTLGCTTTGTQEFVTFANGGVGVAGINSTTVDLISQQQLAPPSSSSNKSYCVSTYGNGWRLPTDVEVGHTNEARDPGVGFDGVYGGASSAIYMWTSVRATAASNRFRTRIDGTVDWELSTILNSNYVRCVYWGGF